MPSADERAGTTTKRKPFTKRERQRFTQNGLGYRPTNDWNSGDLPAPWAEGDVLLRETVGGDDRLHGMGPGFFVVTYATSIDEGDAWYFRVWDGESDRGSDRLHVAYQERCAPGSWDPPIDYMAGFELVETADPDGLALRKRMIADGWAFKDRDEVLLGLATTEQLLDELIARFEISGEERLAAGIRSVLAHWDMTPALLYYRTADGG